MNYYDVEHDPDKEYPITESDLIQEYELNCDLFDGFKEDYPTFGEWLSECLSKDGTLERGK